MVRKVHKNGMKKCDVFAVWCNTSKNELKIRYYAGFFDDWKGCHFLALLKFVHFKKFFSNFVVAAPYRGDF